MTKPYVATTKLYVGTALAYNEGDVIEDETAVARNGWQDSVAREGTKAAENANERAATASASLATGITEQVQPAPSKK